MIGGNVTATIQAYSDVTTNAIGESVPNWQNVQTLLGWLDLSSGESRYNTYNAKVQESTHIFLCDYVPLHASIKAEQSRMLIGGRMYDILLIDNPMEMNQHYEIYLKYTGGQ